MKNKPLTLPEFYTRFANTPINRRHLPLVRIIIEGRRDYVSQQSLAEIYEALNLLEAEIIHREERIKDILTEVSEIL